MKLTSPAKLNLFFRVLNKRSDGFHEIASLMQAISLSDTLHLTLSDQDTLTSSDPHLPTDERNFIHQARTLFRQRTGCTIPVAIHVEKKIPVESGLGGGSSNLATTLWGLNQLTNQEVDEETLRSWAGELSSDAPFFFSTGTAYATGRGEKIKPLTPLKEDFYLVKPEGGLSTPLVYRYCTPNAHREDPQDLLNHALKGKLAPLNDLEVPAFALRPDLIDLKKKLMEQGFKTVTMTGSGTAFFCFGTPKAFSKDLLKASFISRTFSSWY